MNIANFSKGETCKEIYSGLWQWDYGQVLRIQGLDLPTAVEIHFSLQEKGGEAVTRVGTTKDGATDVVIPDSMLENNGSLEDYFIYAFIYLTDETSGQTEYKISMKVKARPKPEAFDSPEDEELFREAIAAVNEAADRAETAGKEAEGWAHGREDMPEKAEDNAKYYADKAAKDAEQTSADRKEVERLVESVSGIDEDVELVRGYKEAAEKAAENAATSAQASEESRKASETAKTAAETAQKKAEEAAGKTAEDRKAVEQVRADAEGMKSQVAEDKSSIEQTVEGFTLTAQQAVADVNNAGQTQTERVQGAGNTAVHEIQTAKEQAVQSVEAASTEQVQAVQTEGTTQIGAVQQKGQEVLDSIPEDFTTQMAGKLDKNQGEESSGKVLVVGGDGTVTPGETPIKVDSTLTQSGQAADAKATGDTITALAIKNQASGEVPIVITDSAEYQVQDLGMEGRTEQQSTTGAQMFDIRKVRTSSGKVINNNDGTLTIQASDISSGVSALAPNTLQDYAPNLIVGNTYTLSAKTTGTQKQIYLAGSAEEIWMFGENKIITEDMLTAPVIWYASGNSTTAVVSEIMLNSGSEALPWEPYTGNQPSPSPDYPQEIINAGKYNEDSQKWEYEVKVTGGNLLDIETGKYSNSEYNNFVNYDSDTGIMNLHSDMYTEDGYIDVIIPLSTPINVVEGKTVFKAFDKTGLPNTSTLLLVSDSGNVLNDITLNGTEGVASRNGIATNLRYRQFKTGGVNGAVKIMVSYDQISDYEPYKEPQTVLLQSDRPLTKWDRLEKRYGQWGWVYKSLIVEFDGSDDENWIRSNQPTIRPDLYILKSKIYENVKLQGENYVDAYTKSDNKQMEQDKRFYGWDSYFGEGRLAIRHDEYSDIAEWKTHLSEHPITWVVKTETETFVPLTESEQAALNALHTNYPTTVLFNDQECEMSLKYVADTKNYIDHKIQESIQKSIAGNLLSTNSNQSLSAPMGAALNLRIEALEAKTE